MMKNLRLVPAKKAQLASEPEASEKPGINARQHLQCLIETDTDHLLDEK